MIRWKILLGLLLVVAANTVLAQSGGEATYKAKCVMCHGTTGLGDGAAAKTLKVKSFKDPDVTRMSEAFLIGIMRAGSGKMPAFKDQLSDAELKAVVSYVRTLQK